MPTFVEAEAQEVGAPAPEVPPATVIEIPWTREPENWAIDSKEKSAFKTNLQRGLTDAYSKYLAFACLFWANNEKSGM